MKKYLSLSFHLIRLSVLNRLAYQQDFIAWTLVTLGWVTFTFVFYELLFANISSVAGWDKGQMYVLQGFVFLLESIVWGFFYFSLKFLPDQIAYGEIDKVIVKPINTQYALSFKGFGIQHLTSFIIGLFTIGHGLQLAGIRPSPVMVFLALIAFGLASLMLYALYFLTVCISFWFDKLSNVIYLIPNSLDLSKVPLQAYSGLTKISLTYLVPIALATSIPSTLLFNRPDWIHLIYLGLFAFFLLALSHYVLHRGLKLYQSASS